MKGCDASLCRRISHSFYELLIDSLDSQRHRGAGEKTTNMCAIERE
jgi:hypothetical protein